VTADVLIPNNSGALSVSAAQWSKRRTLSQRTAARWRVASILLGGAEAKR
jgi:hypothetical protein